MTLDSHTPATVGLIGSGRLGTTLAPALRATGHGVAGPAGRGEVPAGCDALLLCVPDAEIEHAAATVAGAAPLVGHTSGATPLSALAPAADAGAAVFGWHPLQTFAGPQTSSGPAGFVASGAPVASGLAGSPPPGAQSASSASPFAGAGCAVAGSTAHALAFAEGLGRRLGMVPFEIDDAGRAAYHAAASIASNFLVTLQAAAEQVAAGAGLEADEARALLAPLVCRTLDNHFALGPEAALTGPVARGDDATVAAQRDAVAEHAPQLLDLFDELAEHSRRLAGRGVAA